MKTKTYIYICVNGYYYLFYTLTAQNIQTLIGFEAVNPYLLFVVSGVHMLYSLFFIS